MTANPIHNPETKPCPCGKKMIKRGVGGVLLTNPPQYRMQWWCGGCGHTEDAGMERGIDYEGYMQKKWEDAQ